MDLLVIHTVIQFIHDGQKQKKKFSAMLESVFPMLSYWPLTTFWFLFLFNGYLAASSVQNSVSKHLHIKNEDFYVA